LLGPDEPRYAAIGRAMGASGDWVTPRLWGSPWFEKPPLLYWMTALGFKAGLDADLAPRVPVAIVSVAFLVFFFLELRRQLGERVAWIATALLATSVGWLVDSHVAVTDIPMSAALAAAMLIVMSRETTLARTIAAGALLGLAILAKGLAPPILFLPAVWFLRRRRRDLVELAAAATIVAAPWYILAFARNGAPFVQDLIWKQHFARFFTNELAHVRPFWFYVPVLAAVLFPWTPLAALLFRRQLYSQPSARFLLAWFAWGFLFFSCSRNKLPGYILPLLPAVVTLIGLALNDLPERSRLAALLLGGSAALLGFIPPVLDMLPQALASGLTNAPFHPAAIALTAGVVLATITGWIAYRRPVAATGIIALSMTMCVGWAIWWTYPILDRTYSPRQYWIDHALDIRCVPESNRSWQYGLDYYADRVFPDCN
jgi:4-amino-4-deoxy-L-arabinose transferase-like glycosyltransferase